VLLVLLLVLAIPVQASTVATLVGTLSWSEVEGMHVQMDTIYSSSYPGVWALIPGTLAIQGTLEAGATAGKRAWVRGHVAEVSIFGVPTLIVWQVMVCPH